MEQIIKSILDTDLYKCSMQHWVLEHYPEAYVQYTFNNRSYATMTFDQDAVDEILYQIKLMANLKLSNSEYDWMKNNLSFLPISYRQYLAAYHFNPNQIDIKLVDGKLNILINGKWRDTILWEVPLMAIISEVYFKMMDTDWNMDDQFEIATNKAKIGRAHV